MVFIKVVKKNQIIVFILALLLVTVGYISYNPDSETQFVSTTLDNSALADIGDATLVSSSGLVNAIENAISNTIAIDDAPVQNAKTVDSYFMNSRLDRQRMYSQTLDSYQKLADNPNISTTQKSIITTEITKISNLQNAIMIAENLILNKDIDDVVILVNDKNVNVIVKTEDLSTAKVAQIQNIVTRELDVKIDNVHITSR